MTIQSTPQITPQPSVETLVGNQKQEYPKPSIPVENPQDKQSTQPTVEYNGKLNEAQNTLEANAKNEAQDRKEAEMNETQSLNSAQTLVLKGKSTQDKINAYAAGAGIDSNETTIKLVEESNIKASQQNSELKDFRELQEIVNKTKGIQTYQQNMGLIL